MAFFTEYIFKSHYAQIAYLNSIKNKTILYVTYRSFPIFTIIDKNEEITIFNYEKYNNFFLLFIYTLEEFYFLPKILKEYIAEKKIDLLIFDNFINFFYGEQCNLNFLFSIKKIAFAEKIKIYFFNRKKFLPFLAYEMNKIKKY